MQKLSDRAIKLMLGPAQDAAHVGCRSPFSNVRHAAAHFRRAGGDDRAALIYSDWEYYICFHKANGAMRTRHHKKEALWLELCTYPQESSCPAPFPLNPGDKATALQLTGSVNNTQVGSVIPASCVIVR